MVKWFMVDSTPSQAQETGDMGDPNHQPSTINHLEKWFFRACWLVLGSLAVIAAVLLWTPLDPIPNDAEARYRLLQTAPYADGFDFPVGWPDAKGYYDARSFGKKGHMGSDWNGVGGGNTDLGDPVHAVSHGVVIFSGFAGPGWGECILVAHRLPGEFRDRQIDSFYGHLKDRLVEAGDVVNRGQKVGTIGTASGRYLAHLHFEIRRRPWLGVRSGYREDMRWWHDPTAFIRQTRKQERLAKTEVGGQNAGAKP
jgi:murein DD-endopeptidase MepM/ murein hydrolase activator NlpD